MGNELIFVNCDDWHGYYLNGELEYEGHSIPEYEYLRLLKANRYYTSIKSYWVDDNYMHDMGNFPRKFKDLPKEVLSNEQE